VNAEKARRWHFERRMGALLGIVVVGMLGVFELLPAGESVNTLVAAVGIVVVVGLMWRMRRVTYRADAAAAEQVGAGTVLALFQLLVDEHDAPTDHGRLTTLLNLSPPLGARMDRLDARSDGPTGPDNRGSRRPEHRHTGRDSRPGSASDRQ
jgi:Zn-dependent protease with chaperone function